MISIVAESDAAPRLEEALASLGEVRRGEVADARVVIVHGRRALPAGSAPVIAVIPGADLAAIVETLESSPRVAGVFATDDPRDVVALAAGLVAAGDQAIERLAPGAPIRDHAIGTFVEKTRAMAELSAFLEGIGAAKRFHEPIDQCLDEMLMNALYDAPVGADGKRVFSGVGTRERIEQRTHATVHLRYAHDGRRLVVGVRDVWGSLDRATVVRFLYKSLHASDKVDRKAGGAGLGLYLMASSATAVEFHVVPGISTEAICVFDLEAPRLALEHFAIATLPAPPGAAKAAPARALPASRKKQIVRAAIAAGAVAVLGVGGFVAWRLTRPPPPPAIVEVTSEPPGALVYVDGRAAGTTPARVTTATPGRDAEVKLVLRGHRDAVVRVHVPDAGETAKTAAKLELSPDYVRVHVTSTPPGALIVPGDAKPNAIVDRTYTPADIFVEAGKPQRFTLVMPEHAPLAIAPFTVPAGSPAVEKGGELEPSQGTVQVPP